jgi:hypothetical protein
VQRFAGRRAEKGIVPLFGNVDADNQILIGATYLLLELPKLLQSDTIYLFHRDLLLMDFV